MLNLFSWPAVVHCIAGINAAWLTGKHPCGILNAQHFKSLTESLKHIQNRMHCFFVQALVPPNQLLLKVDVSEVDYVHLGDDVRSIWSNSGGEASIAGFWSETEVNP